MKTRLLVRLGSLGDVVLATAAANTLAAREPETALDVLVKSEWAPLWENHPAVRRVLAWTPGERTGKGVLSLARRLRAGGYADAVDLQGSPRTRVLLFLAGIPVSGRPARYARERRLLVRRKRGGPPPGYRVVTAFQEAVGGEPFARPSLHPGGAERDRARELLGDRRPVALVPGARHATKRWPGFLETARRLADNHEAILVLFGPDEDEARDRWREAWPEREAWIDVQEPLLTTAALLGHSRVAVTGDTGLMHVAEAVGTPVVALFGPTVPAFGFAPERGRVLEVPLPCRPCSVHGGPACPEEHFRCLRDITPERVVRTVHELKDQVNKEPHHVENLAHQRGR